MSSTDVLKKNTDTGPSASGFTSRRRVSTGAGMSVTKDRRCRGIPIRRRMPDVFGGAENYDRIDGAIHQSFGIPSAHPSSGSYPASKNLLHQCLRHFRPRFHQFLVQSPRALSSSSGMSEIAGTPPSGPHSYFFIRSTSNEWEVRPTPEDTGSTTWRTEVLAHLFHYISKFEPFHRPSGGVRNDRFSSARLSAEDILSADLPRRTRRPKNQTHVAYPRAVYALPTKSSDPWGSR